MKTLRLKTSATIATLTAMASLAWGGQLTEESIRELIKIRCEAFEKGDAETIIALHTTNAVISASFFGMPGETSESDPREFGESFSKGLQCVSYQTDPIKIEIADGEAVVKAETQLSHIGEKRKRIMIYRISERLEIALIDGHLKITNGQMEIVGQTLEPDELSERIMKLVRQEGGIDKETAVKLLEESGCRYKEGDGKKKKAGSTPTREDLEPLLKHRGGFESLTCEDGGTFNINPIGEPASCSIHGKTDPRKKSPPLKGLSKEDFDIDGAAPGRWTMDLDAAKKLAADKQLPILLNFTGSDWCYWCKLMEKNVFTKPEWSAYATNNIVMVLIDFPRDKSVVPEKFKERNNTLKEQYEIGGYPTFILLKPDGQTELGRLKAGRSKTPASFTGEVKALLNPEVEQ